MELKSNIDSSAKTEDSSSANLDNLLLLLGKPGKYQTCIFLLLVFNYTPIVFNHTVMAFYGVVPPHDCRSYSLEEFNSTKILYGKCQTTYFWGNGSNVTVDCRSKQGTHWFYHEGHRESNIVTEWDLVCDDLYLGKLVTTVYFCGVMVGGLIFGYLADIFGRRRIMLICLYSPIVIGVVCFFVRDYVAFIILRFVQGILMQGLQTSTYTFVMELFLPQYRGIAGTVLECNWGFSVILLSGIAYFIQDWRYIQLAITLPSALCVGYVCLVPESLRWLLTNGYMDQAEESVKKISNFNKLTYPDSLMRVIRENNSRKVKSRYGFMDLVRTPQIRLISFISFYLWFAVAVGYYGLTFKITSLAGNKYLNFFIGGLVEWSAHISVVFVAKRFGRRKPLIFYATVGSISCILSGTLPFAGQDDSIIKASTSLAIIGKFGMGGVFSLVFLFSSELYPTVIRNIGIGSCAFWTRLGGVIAPQILLLGDFTNQSISVIVFGALMLVSMVITLKLPETHGKKLPDTIEDAENMHSIKSME